MGHIEKRIGRYRERYRDPLGRQRVETFTRKADAERFLRETRVSMDRAGWLDPRYAATPLTIWAEEFQRFARRLSPTTQEDVSPRPRALHPPGHRRPADRVDACR